MLKRLLTLIFLLLSFHSYSQQATKHPPRKLLITVEAAEKDQLLIDYIHECLSDLRYESDKDRKVYDSIFDSNTIHKSGFVESLIYDLNKPLSQGEPVSFNTAERIKRDTSYQHLLLHSDQLLLIQITNTAPAHYYYVFTLFAVSAGQNQQKAIPVTSLLKSSYCFVDINNSAYEGIRTAIQQVCTESNIPPKVRILSNAVRSPQGYYMAKGDTLSLWLSISDPDTRRARIKCSWSQLPNGSKNYPAAFDRNDTVQRIVLWQEGALTLTVKANDQSADSKPDTFIVYVIPRPVIAHYFKGSFIKIGKKRIGSVPHVFDDLYQPYIFSRQVEVIEFNRHYIWTAGNRPVDIGLVFTDSTNERINVSKEFEVDKLDTLFMIHHKALHKKAGTFYYQVTLADHGIKAPPLTIQQIYRKASPFYGGFGFTIGQFTPRKEKLNIYSSALFGFFLHPHVHLEYSMEFPLSDSVFGRGETAKYPNHKIAVLAPLPFRFSKKGLLIALELNQLLFRYPMLSKGLYSGIGYGLNVRMLYSTFPWLGTSFRIQHTVVRKISLQNSPDNLFSVSIGLIVLPVWK